MNRRRVMVGVVIDGQSRGHFEIPIDLSLKSGEAHADSLRATLRELAQCDSRLYRGLGEDLGDGATTVEQPRALIQPEGGASATKAHLLALKSDVLQKLCAQWGIKVPKRPRKDLMVGLLLVDPNGPPPMSLLLPPKTNPHRRWEGHGGQGWRRRAAGPGAAGVADRLAGGCAS